MQGALTFLLTSQRPPCCAWLWYAVESVTCCTIGFKLAWFVWTIGIRIHETVVAGNMVRGFFFDAARASATVSVLFVHCVLAYPVLLQAFPESGSSDSDEVLKNHDTIMDMSINRISLEFTAVCDRNGLQFSTGNVVMAMNQHLVKTWNAMANHMLQCMVSLKSTIF